MSIYQPYTYLIGWSHHNVWYYGVQHRKNAKPNNLWKSYFTSSRYVKRFREQYGEPDVIEIRKTFTSKHDALLWEEKVLRRINAAADEKWLNRRSGNKNFYIDEESAKKRGEKHRGFRHTEENKKRISESLKDAWQYRSHKHEKPRVFTEEWRQKLSAARKRNTGTKSPTYGKRWKWKKETEENLGSK